MCASAGRVVIALATLLEGQPRANAALHRRLPGARGGLGEAEECDTLPRSKPGLDTPKRLQRLGETRSDPEACLKETRADRQEGRAT